MITSINFIKLLDQLGFSKNENNYYEKIYAFGCKIQIDESRKEILYQLTKKVYDDALNEIIDSENSSKMIKEYQEEQKKISSEIETLKNFKQEKESTIENYKLLKEKVNEFLEFKELNSLIVHSLISRIEVGYRDNPRTIKIYYKFIDTTL